MSESPASLETIELPHIPAPTAAHIAQQMLDRWAAAFAAMDPDAMAVLYSEQALLFGSKPQLFVGRAGARDYFAALRPRASNSVRFDRLTAVMLAESVIELAVDVLFTVEQNPAIPMRLTQTLVADAGGWLIASHHASPTPSPNASSTVSQTKIGVIAGSCARQR